MKIKKLLLSLSLAGLCWTQSADQAFPQSTKHIGDSPPTAGDTRPAHFRTNSVNLSSALDMSAIAPTAFASSGCSSGCAGGCDGGCDSPISGCDFGSCDGGCDGGCDSACGGGGGGLGLLGGPVGSGWFSVESLLWFAEAQDSPPLVTTSNQGVLPVLGNPLGAVATAFGGENGINRGMMPGLRVEGGIYIDDEKKLGFGGRGYGIFQDAEEYQAASNGSTSLGIPFFNINPAVTGEDAYLVAFTTLANVPVSTGEVYARADLDMYGADASFHALLGRGKNHRFDFIGGYTYNKLKNSVALVTQSTNLFTGDAIADGTIFTTNEYVATENEFNGGHVGLISTVQRKGISVRALSKVAFGNMRQRYTGAGFTIEEFGATSVATAGGIFTNSGNIGSFQQDVFAFIPELGVKLGLKPTDSFEATVGYTMMMWSTVSLAGDQIERHLDSTGNLPSPIRDFTDSSFWMQGIDLGISMSY